MKETDCIKITIPVKLLRCCILNLLFCIHIYLYPITLLKTRIKFKQEMILSPKVLKKTLPVLQFYNEFHWGGVLYILGNAFQGRDLKGEGFKWPVPGFWFKYIRERTDEWISVRGRSSLCNPSFPPPFFLAWSQPLFFIWSLFSFSKHWLTIKPIFSVFFTRLFTFFHWVLVILLDFGYWCVEKGKGNYIWRVLISIIIHRNCY